MIIPPISVGNYAQLLAARAVSAKIVRFAPTAFRSGGETWFDGAGTYVLTDAGAWRRLWDRHIQNESVGNLGRVGNLNPPPLVDFEKSVVVALFAGTQPGVLGYRLQNGYALGKQATVRLAPVVDPQRRAQIAVPRPWAFLILPRSNATISIQVPGNEGWNTIVKVPATS